MLPHGHYLSEHHFLVFLVQILVLLVLARGLGEMFRQWGHPPVVGEILVGLLLGPTLLGRLSPDLYRGLFPSDPIQFTMLETVSWFGVLLLLLETGLEIDVSAAWKQRRAALRIGIIGVVVPLGIGFLLSLLLPDVYLARPDQRITFALFLGTTMAISAMVIIARVLHDLDLIKSDLGLLTLCGYAVNDVLAWVILSLVFATAATAAPNPGSVVLLLVAAVGFTAFCLTLGPRLVDRALAGLAARRPQQPGVVLTFVCCLGLLCGVVTQSVGLTALLGFFLAGMMAGDAHALSERVRQILTQMVHAVFVPLYFASLAVQIDFFAHFDAFLVAFVTVVSIVGKYFGAWLGARGVGLSAAERVSIGVAFTPSGVTGIVVAAMALEYQIITIPVFVAIVLSAILSSLLVGPWLMWSVRRRPAMNVGDLLVRGALIPDLRGRTRDDVIRELCAATAGSDRLPNAATLADAVRAREALMGTGVGNRIAIPHARLPGLSKPVIACGRAAAGIEWDAPDGLSVQLVFLLLTPVQDEGAQLQILSGIARTLTDAAVRDAIVQADDPDDLWQRLQDALRSHDLIPDRRE